MSIGQLEYELTAVHEPRMHLIAMSQVFWSAWAPGFLGILENGGAGVDRRFFDSA
jgi:hypothetical protein